MCHAFSGILWIGSSVIFLQVKIKYYHFVCYFYIWMFAVNPKPLHTVVINNLCSNIRLWLDLCSLPIDILLCKCLFAVSKVIFTCLAQFLAFSNYQLQVPQCWHNHEFFTWLFQLCLGLSLTFMTSYQLCLLLGAVCTPCEHVNIFSLWWSSLPVKATVKPLASLNFLASREHKWFGECKERHM